MTPQEHVSELIAERDKVDAWRKWANWKRCCKCGERAENPWMHEGTSDVICDHCHPLCEEKGCTEPVLMGGEGGCDQHEHLFWEEFQAMLAGVAS